MSTVERKFEYDFKVAAIHKARINIKSLAAEARIIRKEEVRCGAQYHWELQYHRRGRLRQEARYAQLALAFLRGRKYESVEASTKHAGQVDQLRLLKKLEGFRARVSLGMVLQWLGRAT